MSSSVAPSAEPTPGFWASARESIAGTQQDFTEGSIGRAILLLAIPMVLEMSMESLFGIVDVFFVARLGSDAMATVVITESLLTLVFDIALGLSMATTAMVARRVGEKNPDAAAVAAVQSIVLGIVSSVAIGVTCVLAAPRLLAWMGGTRAIVETGSVYTATVLGGSITVMLLFLINAIFRGVGDAVVAMRALWLANLLNMALVPCLINGFGPLPRMGLLGAAVGTTIGRGLGVVYLFWMLSRSRRRIDIRREHLRLDFPVLLRLTRVSLNGILQFFIAMASWLALVNLLARFGSDALAGYGVAMRILVVALLPAWGMSNSVATLVGQNLGAGKPDRAERSAWLTGLFNMIFLGVVTLVFLLFSEPIIRVFTQDPAVVPVGVSCLRYVSYGYVFYAFGMVMLQAFNGAGDTRTPTIVNLFCYWMWQLPLAYVLANVLGMGPNGVFLAIAISESTVAVVGVVMFRRGRWKLQTI